MSNSNYRILNSFKINFNKEVIALRFSWNNDFLHDFKSFITISLKDLFIEKTNDRDNIDFYIKTSFSDKIYLSEETATQIINEINNFYF